MTNVREFTHLVVDDVKTEPAGAYYRSAGFRSGVLHVASNFDISIRTGFDAFDVFQTVCF